MKRLHLGAAALRGLVFAALWLAPRSASAQLYAAADYNSLAEPGERVSGLDAGLGYRVSEYLGVEAGYEGAYSHLPFSGGYFVAMGFLPLGNSGLEAFGDAGGLVLTGESAGATGARRWSSGYRADAGLQYALSPYWTVRAAYRYQTPLAAMHAYVLGLAYSF